MVGTAKVLGVNCVLVAMSSPFLCEKASSSSVARQTDAIWAKTVSRQLLKKNKNISNDWTGLDGAFHLRGGVFRMIELNANISRSSPSNPAGSRTATRPRVNPTSPRRSNSFNCRLTTSRAVPNSTAMT